MRVLSNFFILLISLFLFISSVFFIKPIPIKRSDYLTPPTIIQNLLGGLKIQASDSFWLRAVQDFDHCDQPINEKECKGKSWLYEILNLTTDLDRKFIESFYYGGLALTIIISDYPGASKIFDKGVAEFPKAWSLSYAAGYHALFEEKDKLKASRLFLNAAKNGGPAWLQTTAGKLASEGGDNEFAEQILNQMIETSEDPKLVERLQQKLNESKQRKITK